MAWLKFTDDWDFTPSAEVRVTIGYLKGMRCPVTTEARSLALKHQVAVEIRTPRRELAARLREDPFADA